MTTREPVYITIHFADLEDDDVKAIRMSTSALCSWINRGFEDDDAQGAWFSNPADASRWLRRKQKKEASE